MSSLCFSYLLLMLIGFVLKFLQSLLFLYEFGNISYYLVHVFEHLHH
jgi:hypothetical protein